MIYIPNENEVGMRLDFLASTFGGGGPLAVEGVLYT